MPWIEHVNNENIRTSKKNCTYNQKATAERPSEDSVGRESKSARQVKERKAGGNLLSDFIWMEGRIRTTRGVKGSKVTFLQIFLK